MADVRSNPLDVAVVGGGPAGISACLELSKIPKLKVALFESDVELGGIPRNSRLCFFGFRDLKNIYKGSTYAQKLTQLIQKTSTSIFTEATVLNIIPGEHGGHHRLEVLSERGLEHYESRFILLATGCFESSRATRIIPGTRPSGIFTTGTLMEIVHMNHAKPGKRALIIGSEHVALSCIFPLRKAGTAIAGIVEDDLEIQTYSSLAKAMSFYFKFPIYKVKSVKAIFGDKRLEGVKLVTRGDRECLDIDCDTVVITGKFRPYTPLIDNSSIEKDVSTYGPVVDMNLMTSVQNIFAAGNILRGADMHDLCALEGRQVARNILVRLKSTEKKIGESFSIRAEYPIRFVAPQKINPAMANDYRPSWRTPGFSIQMAHTLRRPVLEAWSGNDKVWGKSFSKLIANTRIPLPVHKFRWSQVNQKKGITLKVESWHG